VTKLQVRTFDLDHLDVFWELNETVEARIEEYDFFVLRSIDGMAGPYKVVAGPFYNTYHFRDIEVHQLHRWRKYFYKIRIVHRETQESWEFGPEWLRAPPDLINLEIQRREFLLFSEFAGRKAFLFPALTFGERCIHCWDRGKAPTNPMREEELQIFKQGNTIGRSKQQNCITCFDTTFVGGYANPILFYIQFDPAPETVQRQDVAERQINQTSARTVAWPPIKAKDIVVEAENIRWRVESMTPTTKLRSVVRQELQLHRIPESDIRYKLPIDWDAKDDFSPRREFTRPMTLGAEKEEAIPDLEEVIPT